MPSAETFSIAPIREFIRRNLGAARVIVDPFARNSRVGTITNDLNPATTAEHHMDALDFLDMLRERGVVADAVLLDPPYSPRQVREVYQSVGREVTKPDTAMRVLWGARERADLILRPGGVVLSFGWSGSGMGARNGYVEVETMYVRHGGLHNLTACVAERKSRQRLDAFAIEEVAPVVA